jgi:hypothetical protein
MRRLAWIAALVLVPVALVAGWMKLPNTLFYQQRRPTRFGKMTNDFMAGLYAVGLTPRFMSTLEVARRKSGGVQRLPVVIARHEGAEYLVSMLGESSEWVKNVRAASGRAVLRHRGAEPVFLDEVPVAQRAPIIKEYLRLAIGGRPHIPVDHRAPVEEFEPLAAAYPVFRIGADVPREQAPAAT